MVLSKISHSNFQVDFCDIENDLIIDKVNKNSVVSIEDDRKSHFSKIDVFYYMVSSQFGNNELNNSKQSIKKDNKMLNRGSEQPPSKIHSENYFLFPNINKITVKVSKIKHERLSS